MDSYDKFNLLIAQVHGLQGSDRPVTITSPDDIQREEFMAMIRAFLGDDYDPAKVAELYALQTELTRRQGALAAAHDQGEISDAGYVDEFNAIAYDVFERMELVLGQADYLKIFGPRPDRSVGFIDGDAFAQANQSQQVADEHELDEVEEISWIAAIKAGEMEAVQDVWERYRVRLLDLANRQLAHLAKREMDGEDIVQSVFFELVRGMAAGRFDNIRNRDDLWWLLLAITKREVANIARRAAAAKRRPRHMQSKEESISLDTLIGDEPTPELVAMLDEQHRRLMHILADVRLREIAVARVEGYTVEEIAQRMALPRRSVETKLKRIRAAWSKELRRTTS